MRLMLLLVVIAMTTMIQPATAAAPTKLFVITGQSNAGTTGDGEELSNYWLGVGEDICLIAPQFTGKPGCVSVPHLFKKAAFGIDKSGFGAELGAYEVLRGELGDNLAFGRRSKGGTSIQAWCSNTGCSGAQWAKDKQFTNATLNKLPGAELTAVFWIQNEADTETVALAKNYEARLRQLIKAWRNFSGNPNLPVLFIAPHTRKNSPNFATVDAAVREIASDTPYTAVIETADLSTYQNSPAHFDAAGTLLLGQRFGTAYLGLID